MRPAGTWLLRVVHPGYCAAPSWGAMKLLHSSINQVLPGIIIFWIRHSVVLAGGGNPTEHGSSELGGVLGHSSGGHNRKDGPSLHRLGLDRSAKVLPWVRSSAGLASELTYLQASEPVSSCTSAIMVPTKTLNRQESDCSQLSTVVESVQSAIPRREAG